MLLGYISDLVFSSLENAFLQSVLLFLLMLGGFCLVLIGGRRVENRSFSSVTSKWSQMKLSGTIFEWAEAEATPVVAGVQDSLQVPVPRLEWEKR